MDRTGWYALFDQDAFLGIKDLPKMANAVVKKDEPIPYSKPVRKKSLIKIKDSTVTKFIVPSTEEVKGYFTERGKPDEHEKFYDFYTSKGWMVGKNKMKDWKAAVRNWLRGSSTNNGGTSPAITGERISL